jgi:hypothetical protein
VVADPAVLRRVRALHAASLRITIASMPRLKRLAWSFVIVLVLPLLAASIAWVLFINTAPVPPSASRAASCSPGNYGFVRSASYRLAFSASADRCWITPAEASRVDEWYSARGWEYGGRVGGCWSTFAAYLGPIRLSGWRRVYNSSGVVSGTAIHVQMEASLDAFHY